jgi:hypothetical protein
MKRLLIAGALLALPAAGFAQHNIEAGFDLGITWALAGDSFVHDPANPDLIAQHSFKDDFDTGWSWNLYGTGPVSGVFGWRAELGRDSMPADADRAGGRVNGDYHLFRYQVGVEFCNYESQDKGRPYAFITLGGVHEDASLSADVNGLKLDVDLDGRNAFGMGFGGGYDWLLGQNWGVGADLHINVGFFEDSSRWWWTPSAQAFYRW